MAGGAAIGPGTKTVKIVTFGFLLAKPISCRTAAHAAQHGLAPSALRDLVAQNSSNGMAQRTTATSYDVPDCESMFRLPMTVLGSRDVSS